MDYRLNLQTPWAEVREKLKEHNVDLSDEDLRFEPGQERSLIERLARILRMSPEETRAYIESVAANTDKAG